LVLAFGAAREGIAAAGQLLGPDGQAAAPGRPPGEAEPEAFPVADLVGTVDDAADDVGAEVTIVRAHREADAVPAASQRWHLHRRHQPGSRPGASDRHRGLAADVLLTVDGEGVLIDPVGRAAGTQPGRQRCAGLAHGDADFGAATTQAGTGLGGALVA